MKSYDELKAEMEAIQKKIVEAKKNERSNALKEVKRLRKEFRAPSEINASILRAKAAYRKLFPTKI